MTTTRPSPRSIALPALAAFACYLLAYVVFRSNSVEVWPRDGRAYVIVPAETPWLYYVFRPLMYADGALTGMRFHIGPHREG